MAASPSSHPLHTLLECRDISEPEIDIIFCGVVRKIIENPLVTAPRTLIKELVNTLETRLEEFCLTEIEELVLDQYQCGRLHVTQEDLINHLFEVLFSMGRHNIL